MPENPEKTGSIAVHSRIELDDDFTAVPDEAGIILDGDTLGYLANPDTLWGILAGTHDIAGYIRHEDTDLIGPAQRVQVNFKEISHVEIVLTNAGLIIITAERGGEPLDSLNVSLNGVDQGRSTNPFSMAVAAGLYNVVARDSDDTTHYEGWERDIEVLAAETTEVDIEMQMVGVWVDVHAPDINTIDIDGSSYNLSDHWGEVIYLYFFEYF